ncbi:MAG: hypothetical protein MUF41_03875 [Sphingopyxis sp.]|nr:hypothetical protein [Sphingopyxis sp.]
MIVMRRPVASVAGIIRSGAELFGGIGMGRGAGAGMMVTGRGAGVGAGGAGRVQAATPTSITAAIPRVITLFIIVPPLCPIAMAVVLRIAAAS